MGYLSALGRRGIAFITGFSLLYAQVGPAYGMQRGSCDEEREPSLPKTAQSSMSSRHIDIINTYVEPLYLAADQEEADAILESIPSFYREEVLNLLEHYNPCSSSSSSVANGTAFKEGQVEHGGVGNHSSDEEEEDYKNKEKKASPTGSKETSFSLLKAEAEDLASQIQAIIESKGGIAYPPFKAKQELALLLPSLLDNELKKPLKHLISNIILPHEYWSDHKAFSSVGHPLLEQDITRDHPSFKSLQRLIEDIDGFLAQFKTPSALTPQTTLIKVATPLQETRAHFESLIKTLCALPLSERRIMLDNKALLCSPALGYYLVPQVKARSFLFLDLYGQTISSGKSNQNEGNNAVIAEGGVHFKTHTSIGDNQLAMEGAMHAFMTLLMGQGLTPSCGLFFENVMTHSTPDIHEIKDEEEKQNVKEANQAFQHEVVHGKKTSEDFFITHPGWRRHFNKTQSHSTVIQASRSAGELSLYEFLEEIRHGKRQWEDFDGENYSAHLLFSLLAIPTDAKDDNLRVTKITKEGSTCWQIIGIDNDKALGQMIVKLGQQEQANVRHLIGGKNILFLLKPLMEQALDAAIYTRFMGLNPYTFMLDWLKAVQDQNDQYLSLAIKYHQEHRKLFPLKFYPGISQQILSRFLTLQDYLIEHKGASHDDLLRHLFPLAAEYYAALYKKDPKDLHFLQHVYLYGLERSAIRDLLKRTDDPLTPLERKIITHIKQEATQACLEEVIESLGELPLERLLQGRVGLQEELKKGNAGREDYETKRTASIAEEIQVMVTSFTGLPLSWENRLAILERLVRYWPQEKLPFKAFDPNETGEQRQNDFQTLLHKILETSFTDGIETKMVDGLLGQALKEETLPSLSWRLNQKDTTKRTYLDYVIQKQSTDLFKRLVSYGAQEIVDLSSATAFYLKHKQDPTLQKSFQTLFAKNFWFQGVVLRDHFFATTPPRKGATPIYLSGYKDPFYLPVPLWNQLFDKKNQFRKLNTAGRREIGLLEEGRYSLFVKKYPAFSGIEQAVRQLAYHLFQENMGYTVLAKINDEPYLLSVGLGRDLKGESSFAPQDRLNPYKENNLSSILEHRPNRLEEIDPLSLSQTILMAMLVNQEDGKPNNFAMEGQAEKYRLISFDNDQAFVPEIMKPQGKGKACPQVKSVLFCLDDMGETFHPDVVKRLIHVDIDDLFKDWLEEMQGIHEADQALFTPQQIQNFWHKKDSVFSEKKECYIGVPLLRRQEGRTEGIGYLYGTLALMQRCVRENQGICGWDLLKAVHPFVAHRYQQGLRACGQRRVGERFKSIDGSFYRGEATLTTSGRMVEAWGIQSPEFIKEAEQEGKVVMPKTALKDLEALQQKRKITELGILTSRGKNNGSIRALLQGKAVESINLDLRSYTNLQEELLLQELTKQHKLQILSLRASTITDRFWPFAERPLTEVQFFECQNLTNALFLLLANHCPLIEKLSVTSAPRVTAVGKASSLFAAAEPLVFKHLKALNLSKNVQLQTLQLNAPHLAHLFLKGCLKFRTLNLTEAPTLETLDIRESKQLKEEELFKLWGHHTTLKSLKAEGSQYKIYPKVLEALIKLQEPLPADHRKSGNLGRSGLAERGQNLPPLTRLTSLDLRRNTIGAAGAQALTALTGLTSLDLRVNTIGAAGAQALTTLTGLTVSNVKDDYRLATSKFAGFLRSVVHVFILPGNYLFVDCRRR